MEMPIRPAGRSRPAIVATLLAGTMLGAVTAEAGTCPTDQVLTTPRPLENAPDVGVTRETLAEVNLEGWHGLGHFVLRTRRLVVAKDGIVPVHGHDDRPSIVTIVSGEIIEHSALCAVPIVHKAGDTGPEFGAGHSHWWENESGVEVLIRSSDVVPVGMVDDPHM
jgi:quercetin dioxygenase-like cupin family protein